MTQFLYVGSYGPEHGNSGDGVVVLRREERTGLLSPPLYSCLSNSPSYLALHPDGGTLYASHEVAEGKITALRTSPTGELTPLNEVATGGHGPCHVLVHPEGSHLIASGYHTGTMAVFGLRPDGGLQPLPQVLTPPAAPGGQQSHPHTAVVMGDQVIFADLGLDALLSYRFRGQVADPSSVVVSALASGSGPRKIVFHPAGHAYVADELSSTVTRVVYDRDRRRFVPTARVPSTTESGDTPNYPAELRLSADGRRLYVTNRGRDSIAVFDTTGEGVRLVAEVSSGGAWPQHILLAGDMLYVANQKSHGVATLRVDPRTGVPRHVQVVDVHSPSCILAGARNISVGLQRHRLLRGPGDRSYLLPYVVVIFNIS